MDFVHEYEQATGRRQRRVPTWRAARDPLHHLPHRQSARAQAIMQIWGTPLAVWQDIDSNLGMGIFIPSFHAFLAFR